MMPGEDCYGFRVMRELAREKKKANQSNSTSLLEDRGVGFQSFNGGVHLIVDCGEVGFVDYWPSTGKFMPREKEKYKAGRGVFNLLKLVEAGHRKTPCPHCAGTGEARA